MGFEEGVFEQLKGSLLKLAGEEDEHREKLLRAKAGGASLVSDFERVADLKIVDYLEDVTLSEDSDFQKILIYAGKREKASYEYYKGLEERFKGTDVGRLFGELAEQELLHKNRIERIYEDEVLRE